MGLPIIDIITGGIKDVINPVNDVLHSWIKSAKDGTLDQEKEKQFQLDLQKVINDQANQVSAQAQAQLDSTLKDTQDARNREIQINNSESSSWLSKNTGSFLALFVTLGFFGILIYMFNYDIPEKSQRILDIMLGSLGAVFIQVAQYFFGSSSGSRSSGEALRRIAEKD